MLGCAFVLFRRTLAFAPRPLADPVAAAAVEPGPDYSAAGSAIVVGIVGFLERAADAIARFAFAAAVASVQRLMTRGKN